MTMVDKTKKETKQYSSQENDLMKNKKNSDNQQDINYYFSDREKSNYKIDHLSQENMNENNIYKETNKNGEKGLDKNRKKIGKISSKSHKMNQTYKLNKFKTTHDFNKKNPASVYMKELKRYSELSNINNKTRNQTARLPFRKLKINDFSHLRSSIGMLMPPYKSSKVIVEETHQKMMNEMKNPKNPYSAYWSNRILEKKYNMKFGVNGFINGVPVITIQRKRGLLTRLKEEKEEYEADAEADANADVDLKPESRAEEEDKLEEEVDIQFNTNQKNFFKVRKDITEGILI